MSSKVATFGIVHDVIVRVWHGWTKPEDGDEYVEFLRAKVFPEVTAGVPGFRGGYVLRRGDDGEEEFLVMTQFDSLEAVRALAGDDYEVPVIEPEAARLLTRGDERAVHYEVVISPDPAA
jgi:antibiotic biosynthesis monooxygenase (ABM) superfamily enzyme